MRRNLQIKSGKAFKGQLPNTRSAVTQPKLWLSVGDFLPSARVHRPGHLSPHTQTAHLASLHDFTATPCTQKPGGSPEPQGSQDRGPGLGRAAMEILGRQHPHSPTPGRVCSPCSPGLARGTPLRERPRAPGHRAANVPGVPTPAVAGVRARCPTLPAPHSAGSHLPAAPFPGRPGRPSSPAGYRHWARCTRGQTTAAGGWFWGRC